MKTEIEQNIQSERETVCRRKLEKRPELLRRIIQAESKTISNSKYQWLPTEEASIYSIKEGHVSCDQVTMELPWKGVF